MTIAEIMRQVELELELGCHAGIVAAVQTHWPQLRAALLAAEKMGPLMLKAEHMLDIEGWRDLASECTNARIDFENAWNGETEIENGEANPPGNLDEEKNHGLGKQ